MRIQSGLALAILAAAVIGGSAGAPVGATARPTVGAGRLEPFEHCGQLVEYARARFLPQVTAWGFGGPPPPPGSPITSPATGSAGIPSAATTVHTTTNVQEQGVDEPDVVKADGSRLFVLRAGVVHALDARGGPARLLGSLRLDGLSPQSLLLHGSRLIVLAGEAVHAPIPLPDPGPTPSTVAVTGTPSVLAGAPPTLLTSGGSLGHTTLVELDVSNPAAMRVRRTLVVDGRYVNARLSSGVARVVVGSMLAPRATPFVQPAERTPEAEQQALERNREILSALPAANWIPSYVVRGSSGETIETKPLVECRQLRRAAAASTLRLTAILTLDLARGLEPVDRDAALADVRTLYASGRALYLAGGVAPEAAPEARPSKTPIHRFDTSRRAETHYRASATVAGALKNQWSLSEHGETLRVVTTVGQVDTETSVTILRARDGELRPLSRIGNLGRREDVYAVRFIGDVGYVVTYRAVDPLYTLDVSDPERPRLLGALKIPGYSAYLHPVGPGLLLGVGQDASDGFTFGTQISSFDVSDLRRPQRIQQRWLGTGSSEVESNHHAFTYWPERRLAVVPYGGYLVERGNTSERPFTGAIGFRIDRDGRFAEVGRIAHGRPEHEVPIQRSVVVGDTLYTISDWGVKANDVATFAPRGAVGLRRPASPPAVARTG